MMKNKRFNLVLNEHFENNTNEWISKDFDTSRPPLIQKIESNILHLESSSKELGVISYIDVSIDFSRDFCLAAGVKITDDNPNSYMSFDFGIKKINNEFRSIEDKQIPTTFGDIFYYFGYSNYNEIIISRWKKGKEKYFFRGHDMEVFNSELNHLKIEKNSKRLSFYINDKHIFSMRNKKLRGKGIGFSTAPNSSLNVHYFKVMN